MRVYLNQFNTPTDRNLLPLAVGKLVAYAKADAELGADLDISIEVLRAPGEHLAQTYRQPSVIGYSCYMWNMNQSLEAAKQAKLVFPGACIVMGGPSTYRNEPDIKKFMQQHPYVDVLVSGEGEITFTELLRCLKQGRGLSEVLGLSFRSGDQIYTNPARGRVKYLDELPSPYLDGTFDKLLERYPNVFTGAIWETNRGCPYRCSFCDWGQATHSKLNIYSIERLAKEIQWMAHNKITYIFSADANFGIKKRDKEIAVLLAKSYEETGYPGVLNLSWVKNSSRKVIEISDVLNRAGIQYQVTLSMQSFSYQVLKTIQRENIPTQKFESLKAEMNAAGMNTYTEILLGLPGETYDSFTHGLVDHLSPRQTDHFIIYLVRLLENTELADPDYVAQHGIETSACKIAQARRDLDETTLTETEHIVIAVKSMPFVDWRRAYTFGYFLAATFNLYLLNVFMNYLRDILGVSLHEYVSYLISQGDDAEGYPVIHKMVSALYENANRIAKGGTAVAKLESLGEIYWEPHEECYLLANFETSEFYADVQKLTLAFVEDYSIPAQQVQLIEALRFQALLAPVFDNVRVREHEFNYDWKSFYENMHHKENNAPKKGAYGFRFTPPIAEYENLLTLALSQLGRSNTGSGSSCDIEYIKGESKVLPFVCVED